MKKFETNVIMISKNPVDFFEIVERYGKEGWRVSAILPPDTTNWIFLNVVLQKEVEE